MWSFRARPDGAADALERLAFWLLCRSRDRPLLGPVAVALPALLAMTENRSLVSFIGYYQYGCVAGSSPAQLLMER